MIQNGSDAQIGTQKPKTILAIFYISGSNHANLDLFEKYLRPGDYLFITTPLDQDSNTSQVLQDAMEAKSKVTFGVKVLSFVWYSKIDAVRLHTPYLPKGIDGVIYDYESGGMYSPEYTTNSTKVLSFFNSGFQISHRNGFKFMTTPVFGDVTNNTEIEHDWNWVELSNSSDFLVVQFQNFFKMNNSDDLKIRMGEMMKEINATSHTPTFVELSLTAIGGTADQDLYAMHELEQVGVNKFLIFFEPWTTDDLRYILEKRD